MVVLESKKQQHLYPCFIAVIKYGFVLVLAPKLIPMIYYRDKTQVQMSCFLNKNLKYDIVTVVLLLLWLFTPRVLQKWPKMEVQDFSMSTVFLQWSFLRLK